MDQNQNPSPQNNNENGPKNKQPILMLLICIMVVMFLVNLLTMTMQGGSGEIKYSEFVDLLEQGKVQEVQIKGETLRVTLKEQQRMGVKKEVYTVLSEDKTDLVKRLERAGVNDYYTEKPNVVMEILFSLISLIVPIVLMFFLLNMLFRRMNKNGGMMGGVGKSKAKAYVQKETGITFKDVAGQDEAKESLQEVVDFLHNPGKYTAMESSMITHEGNGNKATTPAIFPTHTEAFAEVVKKMTTGEGKVIESVSEIDAIGHRVVHGGEKFKESCLITPEVVKAIHDLSPLAPLHNPAAILGIEASYKVFGEDKPNIAVFDTAFHSTMPPKAYMYAIPYEYYEKYGVRRYGFHGTSHKYVSHRAAEFLEEPIERLKLIPVSNCYSSSNAPV